MRMLRWVLPVATLAGGLFVLTTVTHAKPEYGKKEKQKCTYCHAKGNMKQQTDAGKYYKDHKHSFEGYDKK